jgi:hypothetical protein
MSKYPEYYADVRFEGIFKKLSTKRKNNPEKLFFQKI